MRIHSKTLGVMDVCDVMSDEINIRALLTNSITSGIEPILMVFIEVNLVPPILSDGFENDGYLVLLNASTGVLGKTI